MKKNWNIYSCVFCLAFIFNSCVEDIELNSKSFESILIVEALITNEPKRQEIKLSKSYKLEETGTPNETGATVAMIGDDGTSIQFFETFSGTYKTSDVFVPQSGVAYHLRVRTSEGRSYTSTNVIMPAPLKIDNVYPERTVNNKEELGVALLVDSYDPTGNSKYYRYEYQEDYKIVAPFWNPTDIVRTTPNGCDVEKANRSSSEKICYNLSESNTIIQNNTLGLTEDRVSKFPIHFLKIKDPKIEHRYSLLVRQFVQTREAYAYTEKIKDFSKTGSLFSQVQTGFIQGNIFSDEDKEERVVGFFELTSVDEKRVFFNFHEVFPNELPFQRACEVLDPVLINCILAESLDGLKYFADNPEYDPNVTDPNEIRGPYLMVPRACGDCTTSGSPVKPDYWID